MYFAALRGKDEQNDADDSSHVLAEGFNQI